MLGITTTRTSSSTTATSTAIGMGKGFNRARNKQAELAKKMAIAKSQNDNDNDNINENKSNPRTQDDASMATSIDTKQQQQQEKMADFEKLLRTTKGAMPSNNDSQSTYMAPIGAGIRKQPGTRKKPGQKQKQKATKIRGDDNDNAIETETGASRIDFESLIDASTSMPLGPIGAARLVPWVPPFLEKALIVVCDPRSASRDLRRVMGYHASSPLTTSSGKDNCGLVFVTADSLGETTAWMKRNKIDPAEPSPDSSARPTTTLRILCDPRLSFMTKYGIVGDNIIDHQWSMAVLVFDTRGSIVRTERDVEPSLCSELVSNIIKDLS